MLKTIDFIGGFELHGQIAVHPMAQRNAKKPNFRGFFGVPRDDCDLFGSNLPGSIQNQPIAQMPAVSPVYATCNRFQ
jgi:hypothetical protein